MALFDDSIRWMSFSRFLWRRMSSNRVLQVAGSLTFTTLLALVPLLTIALIMMAAFPIFADYSTRFKVMLLSTLMPEFAGKVITVYMRQFADNAERLTAAGVIMLGGTALMLMATIERTFNAIWGVRRSRPWLQQGLVYWSVLTLGPLVLGGGLLLWHSLFKASRLAHKAPFLADLVQAGGSIVLTAGVLTLLFRIVPNRFVPLGHATWGALLTSVLLEGARALFGFYIGEIASYKLVYGAFASVPIVLLWVYCVWLVVLVGAVFTSALSYWGDDAWRRRFDPRRRFLDALKLLILLDAAQSVGTLPTPEDLRREVNVGYDEIGLVLDRLAQAGYVQKGGQDGWVLRKRLSAITLAELFQLFIYRADPEQDDAIGHAVEAMLQPMLGTLSDTTIAAFAARQPRVTP
jgi:membrane protein